MTSTELERMVREKLEKENLASSIDDRKSQFLEFPDGFFVELVLKDGSRALDVERAARELRESLSKRDVDLDVIVRSDWAVLDVGDPTTSVNVSGGMSTAWAFPASLISGSVTAKVGVDVTYPAVQEIKRKLAAGASASAEEKVAMRELVREFLTLQLSFGGESYWDPIRFPKQELNDSALLYMFGPSVAGKR